MKFRESGELLRGRRFSLRMKGMVYQSCVRSAMLYAELERGPNLPRPRRDIIASRPRRDIIASRPRRDFKVTRHETS